MRWLLTLCLIAAALFHTAAATVEIANAALVLGVDPANGRIVRFARRNGENLLWLAPPDAIAADRAAGRWINYGGDRMWPEIQNHWLQISGRPVPDAVIDGGAYRVEKHDDRSLTMTSGLSRPLGIRLIRRIRLLGDLPVVEMINTLRKESPSPFPVQLWSVTQIPQARHFAIHVGQRRDYDPWPGRGYANSGDSPGAVMGPDADGAMIYHAPPDNIPGKLCTLGDYCAAFLPDAVFLQVSRYRAGNFYPDAGACMAFAGRQYAELEFNGGLQLLRVGEAAFHTVYWSILPRARNEALPATLQRTKRAANDILHRFAAKEKK